MKDFLAKRKERKEQKASERSPAEQRRRLLVELVFKAIAVFMLGAAILYAIVTIILGSSLFIPRSASGVLDSAKTPAVYSWSSESMRNVKIRNWSPSKKIAGIRAASIDTQTDKFLANTWGSTPQSTQYLSDGKVTVQRNEETKDSQRDLLNDACALDGSPATEDTADDAALDASLLAFPSPSEIQGLSPEIVDDKATFLGKRAWQISFDPSPEIIKQLLWVPFLDKTVEQNPSLEQDLPWIMSEREREALGRGEYTTRFAYAYVERESRIMSQIYLRVDIILGKEIESQYQILAQIEDSPGSLQKELAKIDLIGGVRCAN